MKLLYCIPALYNAGGMERVLAEKVNYLVNLPNYEITIVTTDQKDRSIRFPIDNRIQLEHLNIDFDGHYSENLLKKYILHKKKLRVYKRRLLKILVKLEIDICISFCGKEIEFLNDLPVKCKKIAEIHFAMNVRKQFLTSRYSGKLWSFLGEIRTYQLKQSVKGLDKLVVLTKADQKQWEQTHDNIIQISNPNPLDSKIVSTLENKKVISVGKLDAQKGYDMLLDAWLPVSHQNPEWELDIFGIGEWEEMLKEKIIQLDLIGKVNLRGATIDVTTQYLNSSIYVMSSRYEGLPMVLIEAMSCGLPIVSFDCEFGPREIITNGKDGYLVKPNNIKGLGDKINFLIENTQKRKIMAKHAIESVKRFSKNEIMEQWTGLFEQLNRVN